MQYFITYCHAALAIRNRKCIILSQWNNATPCEYALGKLLKCVMHSIAFKRFHADIIKTRVSELYVLLWIYLKNDFGAKSA